MVKAIILTVGLALAPAAAAFGQQSALRFGVYDADGEPAAGAVATLLSRSDSTIIDAAIATAEGQVVFPADSLAWRMVDISYPGYASVRIGASEVPDSVRLAVSATELQELVVQGQTLQRATGRFIYDPGSLRRELPNVYEILRFTPMVHFQDGVATIISTGTAKIYINGRDPKMPQAALAEYLRSIPAQEIKRIEIVTNPGSTQRAGDASGIVNIVIEKPDDGLLGSASASTGYDDRFVRARSSVWLGYKRGKFSASGSIAYQRWGNRSKTESDFRYAVPEEKSVSNTTTAYSAIDVLGGSAVAEYAFTPRSTLGASFNVSGASVGEHSEVHTVTSTPAAPAELSAMHVNTRTPWVRPEIGAVLYYTLRTDELGSTLDVMADYSLRKTVTNTDYSSDGSHTWQNTAVSGHGFSFTPKYKWILSNAHRLDAGYDFVTAHMDNKSDFAGQKDDFTYDETVQSAFVQWKSKWSDVFSAEVGIRVENSRIKGLSPDASESFSRTYTDWFPSLSLNFDLPHSQNLSLEFKRRIVRPFYNTLNPFVRWTSSTTCTAGNPDLRPEYPWDVTLYYSFLNGFVLSAHYMYVSENMGDYTFGRGGITVTGWDNFGRIHSFVPSLSYAKTVGIWTVRASTDGIYRNEEATLDGDDISYSHWTWELTFINHFAISKKHNFGAELFYRAMSPWQALGRKTKWKNQLSVGLSKGFNSGWYVSLNVSNILNCSNVFHYNSPDYSYDNRSLYNSVGFSLSVSYTFGKYQVNAAEGKGSDKMSGRYSSF